MEATVCSTKLKAGSLTAAISITGPPASKAAATSSMIEQRLCQQCAARRACLGQPTDRAAFHAVRSRSANGLAHRWPETILVRRQSQRAAEESCWRAAAGDRTRDGWTRRGHWAMELGPGCASCAEMAREMAQWLRRVAREAASAAREGVGEKAFSEASARAWGGPLINRRTRRFPRRDTA